MLSVITPVYNGERFIEKCIKVVIDQNCSQLEHIIVDGGSTDKTVEIIKQYAEKYSHIRWISEKDRGQSDAMNKGVAMAKGKILDFLNVDDYYEPNVLNRVLQIFETLPEPSLLVGNCNVWNSENRVWYVNKPRRLKLTDLLLGPDVNPYPVNPSAYFYHASLHEKIGPYDVDEHYMMDIHFLLKAVQVAHVKYVDETLGNYLMIPGTKTVDRIRSNTEPGAFEQMMQQYRETLPIPQRWTVALGYKLYKAVRWRRLRYFLDEPKNIYRVLLKKLGIPLQKSGSFGKS